MLVVTVGFANAGTARTTAANNAKLAELRIEIHERILPFEDFESAKQDHVEEERVDTQAADE